MQRGVLVEEANSDPAEAFLNQKEARIGEYDCTAASSSTAVGRGSMLERGRRASLHH
jgi:hypothetical protein